MGPLLRAGALQGFDDLVAQWGCDPVALRRRHGLHRAQDRDPEAMVSMNAVAWMLEDAAVACGRHDLGLQLGARQDPKMLGLLALVIQGAATAGDALLDASRYLFVHSPGYQLVVEPMAPGDAWITLRFDVLVDDGVPHRQLIDGCLASLLSMARAFAGEVSPRAVSLPHTPAAHVSAYREVFGAHVSFGQTKAALHVAPDLLQLDLRAAQPLIRQHAIAYIAERYPQADSTATTRVRNALRGTIGATRGTKAEIAALLGTHPRTLQRRLADEGKTFETIADDVRRSATVNLLTSTDLPLGQVAAALGYSEQSAMSRKVRQWFNATPREVRARAFSGPPT
ncbi:AraC family transcriptional regulator [Nocardioides marinus]|uniref:AraC-like DNA-binding protein n=1 Tax=Nocardioides marinus TaxID=374514 RepID=A0A7Y9YI04_9ACTN|nr:AraC-like DNA-binding protein [Nocardioides marinus]